MRASQLAAALDRHPRLPLLDGPTPVQRLERLEQALGPALRGIRLYAKRDDLPGLGGGGNKLRKLEFLLGEARAQGADTFLTVGGLQSNHARLSAAAAARAGLACELFLSRQVPRADADYERNGNILLDGLFGARIHDLPAGADPLAQAQARAEQLRADGRRPYLVGSGGSSPLGCLGYARAAAELAAQEAELGIDFDLVVLPNGSAGTHAGLAAGLAAMGRSASRVKSFTVLAPAERARPATLEKTRATLDLLAPASSLEAAQIEIDGSQLGEGYGIPTEAMFAAVRLLARSEGLLIDPVYGGKAFAGLLAELRDGRLRAGGHVLFLMTGGSPGLFAYRSAFEAVPG